MHVARSPLTDAPEKHKLSTAPKQGGDGRRGPGDIGAYATKQLRVCGGGETLLPVPHVCPAPYAGSRSTVPRWDTNVYAVPYGICCIVAISRAMFFWCDSSVPPPISSSFESRQSRSTT
mmetsp:Transcript_35248/g.79923  ORF Transcript_35248/g.79923 Transcript_35248/m.79923 type:complete len:119 (+) Transcript_35248:430-786(+)